MDRLGSAALMPVCGHEALVWEYHMATQDFLPIKKKNSNIIRIQTKLHRKKFSCFLGEYLRAIWKSTGARSIANGKRQKATPFRLNCPSDLQVPPLPPVDFFFPEAKTHMNH